ncbi:NfeD family protein [Hyphomonas sp.]|uniref:NfeD family protein n=1 Tax=Hyphomonas sp. TaxID=87 RepID=UPI0025BC43A6|nr:NfeD family protein [Hyphomonas sp.]
MEQVFSELTFWHWLVLGLILFGIEMMTGTFDLLMVAIAAWLTAGFAYFAPDAWTVWQWQMVIFGIASTALIVFGRTVLSGIRKSSPDHPTLNRRMAALIGERGMAMGDFLSGSGQVRIGDTVWRAEAVEGEMIRTGDTVVVEGARMTTALVRRATA